MWLYISHFGFDYDYEPDYTYGINLQINFRSKFLENNFLMKYVYMNYLNIYAKLPVASRLSFIYRCLVSTFILIWFLK